MATGALKQLNCPSHEAQVNGAVWLGLDLNKKRQMVRVLSAICEAETRFKRIRLLDAQSGRRLADYSGYSEIEVF